MHRWFRATAFAAALFVVAASCDTAPHASDRLVGPQVQAAHEGGIVVYDDAGNAYSALEGRPPVPSDMPPIVMQVIGVDGGTLSVAGHTLTVPAGALLSPTTFTMRVMMNGVVEVELKATVVRRLWRLLLGWMDAIVDVSSLGFEQPVTVELTWDYATNLGDPGDLVILRSPNGSYNQAWQLVDSEIDEDKRVVRAQLGGFSRYMVACN